MIRILSLLVPARVFALFLYETVLLFGCYVLAAFLDTDIGDPNLFLLYDSGLVRIATVVGCVILGLFFRNLYAEVRIRSRLDLFQNISLVFGVALVAQGVISYMDRDWVMPRRMMLIGSFLAISTLFAGRLLYNSVARKSGTANRLLFIGMSPTVLRLARHFDRHPEMGMAVVGYLETGNSAISAPEIPLLGRIEDIDRAIEESAAVSMIIASREDIEPLWVGEFLTLRFGGLKVEDASTLYERTFARKCAMEIWPSRLILTGASEPNRASVAIQAVYSQVIAVGALLLLSPVLAISAVLARISSGGPIIEREQRVGLHGVPFDLFRFRARNKDGTTSLAGRILARFGLDTLPRLFNLLRGELTIVGPRPEHPIYSSQLTAQIPYYPQRNQVKPGLMGWAEAHDDGRTHDTISELEYDLYYVENISPALDSLTMLLSLKNVFLSGRQWFPATDAVQEEARD